MAPQTVATVAPEVQPQPLTFPNGLLIGSTLHLTPALFSEFVPVDHVERGFLLWSPGVCEAVLIGMWPQEVAQAQARVIVARFCSPDAPGMRTACGRHALEVAEQQIDSALREVEHG